MFLNANIQQSKSDRDRMRYREIAGEKARQIEIETYVCRTLCKTKPKCKQNKPKA